MESPRFCCNRRSRVVSSLSVAVLATAILVVPTIVAGQANGQLQIHQINVGQGDAALIISPLGQTILIDAGPASASACASATGIITYLSNIGLLGLDYHVASHYDADHIGCTDKVVAVWPIQIAAYDRGTVNPPGTQTYTRYADSVATKRQTVTLGQQIVLDAASGSPVTFNVVAVNANGGSGALTENDRSVVLVLRFGAFDAVFGGDLSGDSSSSVHNIEGHIASSVGQVELYKVHHHGSATSSNATFLSATHPKVATLSMSATNSFGHPTATALGNIHAQNATVYWTTAGNGASPGALDVVANNTIVTTVSVGGSTFTMRYGTVTTAFNSWPSSPTCSYSLDPTSASFSASGGSASVAVNTQAGCVWSATSNAGFATITSGASGNGTGTVGYSIASATAPRTGTMTVAELTFSITQSAPAFTDDPLVAGTTTIRSVHITELRTRIDALRIRHGVSAFTWTDETLSGVFIKTVHITELRGALSAVYDAAGVTAPLYTDSPLVAGMGMKMVHIAELRSAVIAIE